MTEYKINDLKRGINDVDIIVTVDFVSPKDTRDLYFGEERFQKTYVVDEEGNEISMTFWGKDRTKVKKGMKVKVTDGYITEYNGMLQLNTRKEKPPEFIK